MCSKKRVGGKGRGKQEKMSLKVCERKDERRKRMYLYFLSNSLLGGFDGRRQGERLLCAHALPLPTTEEEKEKNIVNHYQKLRIRRGDGPRALCWRLLFVLRCVGVVGGEAEEW
jgi:hypothetical protein